MRCKLAPYNRIKTMTPKWIGSRFFFRRTVNFSQPSGAWVLGGVLLGGVFSGLPVSFAAPEGSGLHSKLGSRSGSGLQIRVRIGDRLSGFNVRGYDLSIRSGKQTPFKFNQTSQWNVTCHGNQVEFQPKFPGASGFQLTSPVLIQSPVGFLSFNDRPYREEFRIYSGSQGCDLVNVLDLEKYLDGLVNSEFSSEWNEEAIEAQVVAARTYAYFQMQQAQSVRGAYFDLDATVKDQVYSGVIKESLRGSQAAEKTRGMILTSGAAGLKKNVIAPIKAYYHSTCGGWTELPERVWGKKSEGFKRQVSCPFCSSSPRYRWGLTLSGFELGDLIKKGAVHSPSPGLLLKEFPSGLEKAELLDLQVKEVSQTGRVESLLSVWKVSHQVVSLLIPAVKLRDWIGTTRLRSTWFTLSESRGFFKRQWRFEGRGNGHGVGLCQWGTKTMGEQGFKMASILKYYYPDAELKKLW
ncbi:MAG: SpoIID/LytB domain-containing protein [Bdellovibrionia bacterium]